MSIRNVVKVMNFHALIRVDNAKRKADKYKMMEDQLFDMMDSIVNNRNLILDKKILKAPKKAPAVRIFIGSDFGFCSNYNSQINERLAKAAPSDKKIVIGRKLRSLAAENVKIAMAASELEERLPEIREFLEEEIRNKACSSVCLIYNYYENTTSIYSREVQVYPITRKWNQEEGKKQYTEDFAIEGNINDILLRLVATYVHYELLLAIVNSRAAENVLRQNATTESLKKIDELEEEQAMAERRQKRDKEFQKVIDNYVKKKMY